MPTRTMNGHAEHWKSTGENLFDFVFSFCIINLSYSYVIGKLKAFQL